MWKYIFLVLSCLVTQRKAIPPREPTRYEFPSWLGKKCLCKLKAVQMFSCMTNKLQTGVWISPGVVIFQTNDVKLDWTPATSEIPRWQNWCLRLGFVRTARIKCARIKIGASQCVCFSIILIILYQVSQLIFNQDSECYPKARHTQEMKEFQWKEVLVHIMKNVNTIAILQHCWLLDSDWSEALTLVPVTRLVSIRTFFC